MTKGPLLAAVLHRTAVISPIAMLLTSVACFARPLTFESADTPTGLIELYTSEGCSSCPPADAWMSQLKGSPELWKSFVPVVFHVDYWNSLGWPDRFATATNTARQRSYAASWGSNRVYTPGFVLNGREWRNWSGREAPAGGGVEKAGKLRVTLREHTHADVIFTPASPVKKSLRIEVALLGGDLVSDVRRGENSGHKLRHDFVVLNLSTTALIAEGDHFTAALALPGKTTDTPVAIAAWVVGRAGDPPLQATGGWLAPR